MSFLSYYDNMFTIFLLFRQEASAWKDICKPKKNWLSLTSATLMMVRDTLYQSEHTSSVILEAAARQILCFHYIREKDSMSHYENTVRTSLLDLMD